MKIIIISFPSLPPMIFKANNINEKIKTVKNMKLLIIRNNKRLL
jgi:hypothetical protein